MREDSPRWEQINASSYVWEQHGLRELAGYLPDADPYHVWTNVEFVGADGSINEVDALELTPSGLLVLELKHWQGEIRGDGTQWLRRAPTSRLIPEDNPYILANRKAKRLASLTGTRMASTHAPLLGLTAADEVGDKLASAVERRAFLAVLAPLRRLGPARRALLARLRSLGFPWEAIVAADNGSPLDADFRSLVDLVRHQVVPAVSEAIAAADGAVLITEAAPLVRYGQVGLLQELADPTRPRPAARLLLVPARRPDPAVLDGTQLPLTSPGSQSLWLADDWIESSGRASSPTG